MGRIDQIQQRKFRNRVALYIGLLALLAFLTLTSGFNILLNASTYVASIFSKPEVDTVNKRDELIGIITIESIPQATNSAKLIVSGTVVNFEKLKFFINKKIVKEKTVNSDIFSEEIAGLENGLNQVYVRAETEDGANIKQTVDYEVIFKNEKPKLEIKEPADGSQVNSPEVTLIGSTDKEILVRVNDNPVVVDASGQFQANIRLKEGENTIFITAADLAGNTESKSIKLVYQKE